MTYALIISPTSPVTTQNDIYKPTDIANAAYTNYIHL